jgi:hypothetical protein
VTRGEPADEAAWTLVSGIPNDWLGRETNAVVRDSVRAFPIARSSRTLLAPDRADQLEFPLDGLCRDVQRAGDLAGGLAL